MRSKGVNLEQAKRANRLLVLRLICTAQMTTRTEITQRVGLAKMTVSNIVAELLRAGVLREIESTGGDGGAGRPQTGLLLSEQAPAVLGIWISRDCCVGVRAGMNLEILAHHQVSLEPEETAESLLDKLEKMAREMLQGNQRPVLALGIAAPGPLELEQGILLNPPDFYGIRNVPLAAELENRLGMPVFLQNDMNAAALAEKLYGDCTNRRTFAYVGLTNGIGAGLILNDSLFTGQHGFAGEIGHTVVDSGGPLCSCGKQGCLEAYITIPRLMACLCDTYGNGFSNFAALCAFCEENTAAAGVLRQAMERLAIALVNLCNTIDPEAIVIGHEGAALTDSQLTFLSERVNAGILAQKLTSITVQRSSFGAMAPVCGAVVVALMQVFNGGVGYDCFFA